jgi:hypothetical protein
MSTARIIRMQVEFVAGSHVHDVFADMLKLADTNKADVDTVFNDRRIIICDNKMFERFGYGKRNDHTR